MAVVILPENTNGRGITAPIRHIWCLQNDTVYPQNRRYYWYGLYVSGTSIRNTPVWCTGVKLKFHITIEGKSTCGFTICSAKLIKIVCAKLCPCPERRLNLIAWRIRQDKYVWEIGISINTAIDLINRYVEGKHSLHTTVWPSNIYTGIAILQCALVSALFEDSLSDANIHPNYIHALVGIGLAL